MTKERSEEVLLIAIVLSVALHILLMVYAKSRVMTHVAAGVERQSRRPPMRVTGELPGVRPVRIDAIDDIKAEKDAPRAQENSRVSAPGIDSAGSSAVMPGFENAAAAVVDGIKPKTEDAYRFKEESLKLDERGSVKIPVVEIETPAVRPMTADGGYAGAPAAAVPVAIAPRSAAPAVAVPVPAADEIGKLPREEKLSEVQSESFTPASEVFEKVDERIVEREKAAVRELVDAPDAEELAKFVNVAATAQTEGPWTYFKVLFSPRSNLPVVPKDFVVLIDASGSIGKDRIKSIRAAARGILRSAANSGDRFNLVAFRDRYSYAFRSWQRCTGESFAAADRWLSSLAVHGRTDVFATISSVLTLPRDPQRPLIALVVTDGDANSGVSSTAEILSKFTALNDGLISVYMYGVRSTANRELIDTLTRGNRGESFVYDGMRWRAGSRMEELSERFRDPVLSDLRLVFSSSVAAEAYPRRLKNIYRGGTLELVGRVPAGTEEVAFSLKGLGGRDAYEGFFRIPLADVGSDRSIPAKWREERNIDERLR